MGLTSALNTALFGLTYNQRQLDVAAQNIANADTAGYTTKEVSAKVFFDGDGNVSGLLSNDIKRAVSLEIQTSYFDSLADTEYAKQIANYTNDLDQIFGTIEDSSNVAALSTELTNALSALVNDPGGYAAQLQVVAAADALSTEIRTSYEQIQNLRQQADSAISLQVETVNSLLQSIQDVDSDIRDLSTAGASTADLQDQRDRYVEQLSGYIDVNVSNNDDGTLLIRSNGGELLYSDNKASTLSFTPNPVLQPGQAGNAVMVSTPGGTTYNLITSSNSGSIVALTELRDEVLVEAQAQLDEIAAEVSLAFSNVTVESTAATVGPDTGYVLDLSALRAGNTITISYIDAASNPQTATLVAVEDPTLLPLSDSATPRADDTVYGVDISSGVTATYVTNIIAALGATGLNVADDGSGNLQVLGNTGTGVAVNSLTADVSVDTSSDEGLGLNVFADTRDGTVDFTDALENGGQRLGYAMGIAVNPELAADPAQLVLYETTPAQNSTNDPARAQYLLNVLTNDAATFDADAGIGSATTPFQGTVLQYVNQVVAHQGNQAQDAQTYSASKTALTTNLAIRYEESYAVNVDEEMAFLVTLQNAYAANARVMQAVNDMFERLLNIT
ncbi:MAG: flagellar hook-associated protein FlgK [Roseibium sp.]|nr:flagellar hook-associated protein FlgK [Roseibium sp.]